MFIQLLSVLAYWCISISVASTNIYYDLKSADKYFEEFIVKFEKQYINEHEKASRFEIFKLNLEEINRLNEESDPAVYGITGFADLTSEEMKAQYSGLRMHDDSEFCTMLYDEDIVDANAPETLDWREFNAVTAVKNMGPCISSWAFSAAGHLEGQLAIKHKQLLELSVQQLIDCDIISDRCCGGLPAQAFKAAIKIGGVMLDKDYPYVVLDYSSCQTDLSKVVVKVTDCFSYNLTSQEKLKQLLYKIGPISIGIRVPDFHYLQTGIIPDEKCKTRNNLHAALLVGYGSENNKRYWIVKTSFDTIVGKAGYLRLERSENPDGACGMLNPSMSTAVIE